MGIENIDVTLPSDAVSELDLTSSDTDIAESPSASEKAELLKEDAPVAADLEDVTSIDEAGEAESVAIETPTDDTTEILTASESEVDDIDETAEEPLDGVPLEEEIIEEEVRRRQCDEADTTPIGLTEEHLNTILQNAHKPILERVNALGTQLSDVSF